VIDDDQGVTSVRIGNIIGVVFPDGRFEIEVRLTPGANSLIVAAIDAAGNQGVANLEVYYGHQISVGNSQGAIIRGDVVRTWGRNELGQLGNGSLDPSGYGDDPATASLPATYDIYLPGTVSIVTRQTFMVALRRDGTVWTWGDAELGQLGYEAPASCGRSGETPCQRIPQQVPNIYDAIGIAAGFNHTLVLLSTGRVMSFGDNSYGQLGRRIDGLSSSTPYFIEGIEGIVQVGAGSAMSYALTSSGNLYAFGANDEGQLGLGTMDEDAHVDPIMVNLGGVKQIAATNRTALAMMRDGSVMTWGQNHKGQAGVNVPSDQIFVPTGVTTTSGPLSDVVSVFGDGFVSGALTSDGRVFMWGLGQLGQLGQGSLPDGERDLDDRLVASEVAIGDADRSFFDIVEGEVGAGGPALALSRNGDVYGWGWSFRGSLGLSGAIDAWAYSSPVLVFPAE
jgi:alpha-tubulin suppressor-like RCC1 family protein